MSRVDSQRATRWLTIGCACVFSVTVVSCGEIGRAEDQSNFEELALALVSDWPSYGGDPGGTRYSPLDQINRQNVGQLQIAWTARTGMMDHEEQPEERQGPCSTCHGSDSKYETTPVLADGTLYVSTPVNRVVAIDAASGAEQWSFDPDVDLERGRAEGFISRGVSLWEDPNRSAGDACQRRVFLGTIDAELFALDARTGTPCRDFGDNGEVDLSRGVGRVQAGQYSVTSPPAIIGDLVIVGSAIGDNRRVDMERGTVRAYDARTGDLRWSWDPIPRTPDDPGWESWTPEAARVTGAANAWPPLSVDVERGLVFVPTGSPAPDFYGGERIGDNLYSNSVVALNASTGEIIWHYQVVHHDLWDYDIPMQPSLITVPRDGEDVPAVAVGTKMGFIFVLHRETGEPLFPVEERPVPQTDVEGERTSPTQPFPVLPPPLHPITFSADEAWGISDEERAACRAQIEALRAEGIFTPPSERGTLFYPGFGGGMNWGGLAFSPDANLLVANTFRITMWVRLQRRSDPNRGNQRGTPYTMSRAALVAPSGLPCNPPPWGTIAAVDLATGMIRWERPLGIMPGLEEVPGADQWGSINMGGPIVTAGGLVFIGASMDDRIRAFDLDTGDELWQAELPAGGQATPMTYQVDGKQYVVIVAGGHGILGTTQGDYVVAFALP